MKCKKKRVLESSFKHPQLPHLSRIPRQCKYVFELFTATAFSMEFILDLGNLFWSPEGFLSEQTAYYSRVPHYGHKYMLSMLL